MATDGRRLQWISSELIPALYDRSGMAGEQYRKLTIRLEALKDTLGGQLRIVLVTSPLMGEGKTMTSANLAIMLAHEEGRRVALVDCDVRKPRIWTYFQEAPSQGLVDVLVGGARLEAAILRTEGPVLDVLALPRGSDPRVDPFPVERLRSLFREMRESYDYVVVDAPPVLPFADTASLARLSDGMLLVVRAGMTPRHALAKTLEGIDRNKLIGFVLNGIAEKSLDRYYYRYHAEEAEARKRGRNGKT